MTKILEMCYTVEKNVQTKEKNKMIPKDPVILLSYTNTQLRDFYKSFEDFCTAKGVNRQELEEKLSGIGYQYDGEKNQFV